jgi:acetylornithine deacetylase/succinyl-diaminopimelate desuccinylase-like protein
MRYKVCACFCAALILSLIPRPHAALPPSQSTENLLSTVDEIKEDFQSVPCRLKDRQAAVQALFQKMGAPAGAMAVEKRDNIENLVLRRDSPTDETIVIGAHYDHVERGCGAIDNWTGIVALAHVYRSASKLSAHKKTLFVAFGSEELGLLGSKAMVRAIHKEDRPNYCAMINIDSFGLASPFAMENTSSKALMELAKASAEQMKIPFYTVPVTDGDADSSSFNANGIPAVTLSGVSNNWKSILHTSNDQPAKVVPLSVYLGYRLALSMWRAIDEAPCSTYRMPSGKTSSLH